MLQYTKVIVDRNGIKSGYHATRALIKSIQFDEVKVYSF